MRGGTYKFRRECSSRCVSGIARPRRACARPAALAEHPLQPGAAICMELRRGNGGPSRVDTHCGGLRSASWVACLFSIALPARGHGMIVFFRPQGPKPTDPRPARAPKAIAARARRRNAGAASGGITSPLCPPTATRATRCIAQGSLPDAWGERGAARGPGAARQEGCERNRGAPRHPALRLHTCSAVATASSHKAGRAPASCGSAGKSSHPRPTRRTTGQQT